MKLLKRASVFAVTAAMMLGTAAMQAFAASTYEQNGIHAELSTYKQEYTENENISAFIQIKNITGEPVKNVNVVPVIPDGYKLADDSAEILKKEQNRNLVEGMAFGMVLTFEPISEESSQPEESSELESSQPEESSEPESSQPEESSEPESSQPEESSKPESSQPEESSKPESSQPEEGSKPPVENSKSGGNILVESNKPQSSTIEGKAANDQTVNTGDNDIALIIFGIVMLGSVVLVLATLKTKKGRKLFSILLSVALIGSVAVIVPLDIYAAAPVEKNIQLDTEVSVNGNTVPIIFNISFTTEEEDQNLVTISGKTVGENDEPLDAVKVTIYDADHNTIDSVDTAEDGTYSFEVSCDNNTTFTLDFVKDGYVTQSKTIIDVAEDRTVNVKLYNEAITQSYSQYFVLEPVVSSKGDQLINEYGIMLITNEDAVIEKCAVYMEYVDGEWERTMAFVGDNITSALYVPYLAYDDVIYYDGINTSDINIFKMIPDSDGIWSSDGIYTLHGANIDDKDGNYLTLRSKDVVGRNVRIFDDLSKMKEWLLS